MYLCWDLSYSLSESWDFNRFAPCMSSPFESWAWFGVIESKTSLQYGSALHYP